MSSQEVIELSVEETNELRAKLGLKPLRIESNNSEKEELSLSVEESNKLRLKLGLAPLRHNDSITAMLPSGKKQSEAIHAPAANLGSQEEARKRIEKAKLKRDVEAGLQNLVSDSNINNDHSSSQENVMDWAEKMRTSNNNDANSIQTQTQQKKKKKKKKIKRQINQISIPKDDEEESTYTEQHLKGLKVSHAVSDFGEGSTTILTLADHSIYDHETQSKNVDDMNLLENVNMVDASKANDNLKRKRQVEMGMGHAGGYVGYDDDEFEELGGAQIATATGTDSNNTDQNKKNHGNKGFTIGSISSNGSSSNNQKESNLFSHEKGKAIDLSSYKNASSSIDDQKLKSQSEFLTHEEDLEAVTAMKKKQAKEEKRRRKEEKKQFKKLKKKQKRSLRSHNDDNDDDDDDDEITKTGAISMLEQLESSATTATINNNETNSSNRNSNLVPRKRRSRNYDSSDDEDDAKASEKKSSQQTSNNTEESTNSVEDKESQQLQRRKDKFDRAVNKGNRRTAMVFEGKRFDASKTSLTFGRSNNKKEVDDIEDDDAFLSAALAKARRLQKLRKLNSNSSINILPDSSKMEKANKTNEKGANAVVMSIQSMEEQTCRKNQQSSSTGVVFEYDETREFTRALKARSDKLSNAKKESKKGIEFNMTKSSSSEKKNDIAGNIRNKATTLHDGNQPVKSKDDGDEAFNENLDELSKHIKEDTATNNNTNMEGFGSTANARPVGRGLANFLSMLKHTGEITGKNAGKEEMRGRAKDKRTYEDYAPLDLESVVNIDKTGLNGAPNAKDLEFATREINLEYRDEHGRLLTRKEAYRNLCYAFHGYGSSKKNQERKLKQIERERESNLTVSKMLGETTNNTSQGSGGQGTFGALKATQRATGKAFVVHKI